MEYSIESLLCEMLENKHFEAEKEMLNFVEMTCDDVISDIGRFQRKFESAPEMNANNLDITVDEYESDDDELEDE